MVRTETDATTSALRVRVPNNARARRADARSAAGQGVLGIRERAAMPDGEFSAGPAPGGGYEVAAVLPIPATPESLDAA